MFCSLKVEEGGRLLGDNKTKIKWRNCEEDSIQVLEAARGWQAWVKGAMYL